MTKRSLPQPAYRFEASAAAREWHIIRTADRAIVRRYPAPLAHLAHEALNRCRYHGTDERKRSGRVYAARRTGRMVIEYIAPFGFSACTYGEHLGYFGSNIEAEWGIEDFHAAKGLAYVKQLPHMIAAWEAGLSEEAA